MLRPFALICSLAALLAALPAQADPAIDTFARNLDRSESVRAVKTLTRDYAQYAQYGLWSQAGALFAPDGQFVFEGVQTVKGPAAIATFLRSRYGAGQEGMTKDGLSTMMVEMPLINLSADGDSAKARWEVTIFHGHNGQARIEGGVFENDYAREVDNGKIGHKWKITTAHYYPQHDAPYEQGLTNWGGGDLPVPPYHFDTDTMGMPIPPAPGPAPNTKATIAALQRRVDALNDEDRIRNLQSMLGYYQDRKMWDDVTDLFTPDGVVEIGGQGVWKGPAGIRRYLETMGPPGLKHGQLNDRVQFDTTVTIAPGGNEAYARGIEIGMLAEADQEQGWWEVATFRNRFVKENGVWKLREMRRFVQAKADTFQGWGKSHIVDTIPEANKPDAPLPAADAASLAMPAFLTANPVTGKPVMPAGDSKLAASTPLTGAIAAGKLKPIDVTEGARRLARAAAYDGALNIAAAYGYYIDDGNATGYTSTLAEKGFKESPPLGGFFIGRDRNAAARVNGKPPTLRAELTYHILVEPVLLISDDGRSVSGPLRLFQPRTGKTSDPLAASFWGGMYYEQYVLEKGSWRIWNLTLDEPFINPVPWKDGIWAKAKDPVGPIYYHNGTRPSPPGNLPPDITLKELGAREEHVVNGSGETRQWPTVRTMWFQYTNPVSGRVPEFRQDDCVPCVLRPDLRLDHNGYQQTPDAPVANKSP